MKVTARRGTLTVIESGLDRETAGRVALAHALKGRPCTVTEEETDVELLHDDTCAQCRRIRRQRRRATLVRWAPAIALVALVVLMAIGEWLTHAVGP